MILSTLKSQLRCCRQLVNYRSSASVGLLLFSSLRTIQPARSTRSTWFITRSRPCYSHIPHPVELPSNGLSDIRLIYCGTLCQLDFAVLKTVVRRGQISYPNLPTFLSKLKTDLFHSPRLAHLNLHLPLGYFTKIQAILLGKFMDTRLTSLHRLSNPLTSKDLDSVCYLCRLVPVLTTLYRPTAWCLLCSATNKTYYFSTVSLSIGACRVSLFSILSSFFKIIASVFKRNAKAFSLSAIVDVCLRRHEIIIFEYLGNY